MCACACWESRKGERANGWHLAPCHPSLGVPATHPVTPNDRAEILPKVTDLTPPSLSPPRASPLVVQARRAFPAAPLPVNVPICFPKCSEEEFITVFCSCGQKLIKRLFLLNLVNWSQWWPGVVWVEKWKGEERVGGQSVWPFTDVYHTSLTWALAGVNPSPPRKKRKKSSKQKTFIN